MVTVKMVTELLHTSKPESYAINLFEGT